MARVFAFENIILIGNEVVPGTDEGFDADADGFFNEFGENAYNIRLTNELLDQNGVVTGGVSRIFIRNDNGSVGGNTGVTIDATLLDANESFQYDGQEGTLDTADRFIMSDININGNAIIDGGATVYPLDNEGANFEFSKSAPPPAVLVLRSRSTISPTSPTW